MAVSVDPNLLGRLVADLDAASRLLDAVSLIAARAGFTEPEDDALTRIQELVPVRLPGVDRLELVRLMAETLDSAWPAHRFPEFEPPVLPD